MPTKMGLNVDGVLAPMGNHEGKLLYIADFTAGGAYEQKLVTSLLLHRQQVQRVRGTKEDMLEQLLAGVRGDHANRAGICIVGEEQALAEPIITMVISMGVLHVRSMLLLLPVDCIIVKCWVLWVIGSQKVCL